MKVTAWRDVADMFAQAVNEFPTCKFRLSNMEVTAVNEDYRMGSNVDYEVTLKRPIKVRMIQQSSQASYAVTHCSLI